MKRLALAAAAALALGIATVGLAAPASAAGAASCTTKYSCLWWDNGFSGGYQFSSLNTLNIARPNHNSTSSAKANGGMCRETRFYDEWISGTVGTGSYFTLYSATMRGYNYEDPNLGNGVGFNGVGINWNDRVSSFQFTRC